MEMDKVGRLANGVVFTNSCNQSKGLASSVLTQGPSMLKLALNLQE